MDMAGSLLWFLKIYKGSLNASERKVLNRDTMKSEATYILLTRSLQTISIASVWTDVSKMIDHIKAGEDYFIMEVHVWNKVLNHGCILISFHF